uniref:Uncharacterized protein n=2 Tax=Anopheles albimanus TaxID=7167 RepID=A0A182FXX9_ANOAL
TVPGTRPNRQLLSRSRLKCRSPESRIPIPNSVSLRSPKAFGTAPAPGAILRSAPLRCHRPPFWPSLFLNDRMSGSVRAPKCSQARKTP